MSQYSGVRLVATRRSTSGMRREMAPNRARTSHPQVAASTATPAPIAQKTRLRTRRIRRSMSTKRARSSGSGQSHVPCASIAGLSSVRPRRLTVGPARWTVRGRPDAGAGYCWKRGQGTWIVRSVASPVS